MGGGWVSWVGVIAGRFVAGVFFSFFFLVGRWVMGWVAFRFVGGSGLCVFFFLIRFVGGVSVQFVGEQLFLCLFFLSPLTGCVVFHCSVGLLVVGRRSVGLPVGRLFPRFCCC